MKLEQMDKHQKSQLEKEKELDQLRKLSESKAALRRAQDAALPALRAALKILPASDRFRRTEL